MHTFRTSVQINLTDLGLPHVILVGLPGAGKTTVGRAVAEKLGRSFLDFDEEIERREGMPLAQKSRGGIPQCLQNETEGFHLRITQLAVFRHGGHGARGEHQPINSIAPKAKTASPAFSMRVGNSINSSAENGSST